MKRFPYDRHVFLVSSVLVLGGCGGTPLRNDVSATGPDGGAVTGPNEGKITGLHFTTSSAFAGNPRPTNVDVTLADPTPSRAIYDATLALPDFPPGTFHCPVDLGYGHTIIFMNGQAVAATATLNSGGCRSATISGAPPVRQTTDAYWALVAKNLGIEEATLFSLESQ